MQFGEYCSSFIQKHYLSLEILHASENYSIPNSQYTPMSPCVWFICPDVTDRRSNIQHNQISLINMSHNRLETVSTLNTIIYKHIIKKQANKTPYQKHSVTQAENEDLLPQENH